ncbi:MAG: pyridoxamine 5'-phosphate oxidase family protein [Actinomycetes bacterium]
MRLPLMPKDVVAVSRSLTRSAVDNARAAGESLSASVRERKALAPRDTSDLEHGDLAVLDEQECLRLMAARSVGRFAYVARAGTPDIAPVNYVVDGRDVLVRSGPGPKLQAAERRETVAFEVDEVDEATHTGWSVVVVGRAQVLPESERARVDVPAPWSSGPRRHVVRITPARITGRRLV